MAVEAVEGVLARAPLVAQIFVHGDSSRDCLVAVVVPDEEQVTQWRGQTQGMEEKDKTLKQLCEDPSLQAAVMAQLDTAASEGKLSGFEKVSIY